MSPIRSIRAHLRLLFSAVLGLVGWLALGSAELPASTRTILALDLGGLLFLAQCWVMMVNATPAGMRRRARAQDEGRLTILVLTFGAAAFSVYAIAQELHGCKDLPAREQAFHISLAAGSIVVSWLVTHTIFALHYAHGFYGEGRGGVVEHAGGLDFPQCDDPDYWDFLYFSFVIAMTAQTSDTQVTSRPMRRLALAQGVLAFFFNTVILAMSINIAAGLL